MKEFGVFPFGQPVQPVKQLDQSPKKVFVLGVYASAVHARWIGPDGRIKVKALAVASEPYIFWKGEKLEQSIKDIQIPEELGHLVPAAQMFNGPSGKTLDDYKPLGLTRKDAWICDLVPYSCANPGQYKAIDREYKKFIKKYPLSKPTVPKVPKSFADDNRRREILAELRKSKAKKLILLVHQPVKWFLKVFQPEFQRLSDFGVNSKAYGSIHKLFLDDLAISVLPLTHPRQTAKLGMSSVDWYELHQDWIDRIEVKNA